MKKITLFSLSTIMFFVLFFSSQQNLNAQSDNAGNTIVPNLTLGVKGGITYGFLAEDYKSRFTDPRFGYMIGVSASYYIMDWLAVSPEIYYMEHGGDNIPKTLIYSENSGILYNLNSVDLEIRTLEIPVLATLHFPGSTGDFLFKVIAGPSFGYTLNATLINAHVYGSSENSKVYSKDDFTDGIDYWEYTGTLGAGFDIKTGSFIVSIDARYRAGLSNLHARDNSENFRSNTYMVTVGVGF